MPPRVPKPVSRTWIVPASSGRHSPLPGALVKAHLPGPLVVQRRFVPARVAVQVHHFDVRERLHEFAVVHPVNAVRVRTQSARQRLRVRTADTMLLFICILNTRSVR